MLFSPIGINPRRYALMLAYVVCCLPLSGQACDGMHSKYPTALNLQARVMYHVGDADSAVALQLKALAYFEQLEGLDSSSVRVVLILLREHHFVISLY